MSVDAIMMGFTNGIPEYGIQDRLWPDEIAKNGHFIKPCART